MCAGHQTDQIGMISGLITRQSVKLWTEIEVLTFSHNMSNLNETEFKWRMDLRSINQYKLNDLLD